MKEKIKVLSIVKKKIKKKTKGAISLFDVIEKDAPGVYTFITETEANAINAVETLRPDIIWLTCEKLQDSLELLKKIKEVHPVAAVFVMVVGAFDDEQEVSNSFLALGAYKCYFIPPILVDVLVHDMYVAINLE